MRAAALRKSALLLIARADISGDASSGEAINAFAEGIIVFSSRPAIGENALSKLAPRQTQPLNSGQSLGKAGRSHILRGAVHLWLTDPAHAAWVVVPARGVHKSMLAVVVTDPVIEGQLPFERREFGTVGSDLRALADWLAAQQVQIAEVVGSYRTRNFLTDCARCVLHPVTKLSLWGRER